MRKFRLTRLPIWIVSIILLLSASGPLRIHAADPIQISNQSMESKFHETITFHITATSSAGKIKTARLFLQARFSPSRTVQPADPFTPAATVDLKYTMDVRSASLPPWQFIRYAWEISDEQGNVFTTPYMEDEYTDDTHPWKTLDDGKVKLYWYGLSDSFGKSLFKSAQRGYAHVSEATGFTPDHELRVVVYPNQEDYLSFYGEGTSKVQEWTGGQTYGDLTVQWVESTSYTLYEVVPHELAHAFLYERMEGKGEVPTWLNEGQAMNNELVDIDTQYLAPVRRLAQRNKLFRMSEMETYVGWVGDLDTIQNWYFQATSMVAFLYDKFGLDILGKLVSRLHDDEKMADAIKAETGWTMLEFETEWRKWVGAPALTAEDLAPTPTVEMPSFPPTPNYDATAAP